jgi:hypothetical protein
MNLEMPEEIKHRIEELQVLTYADSMSEVIRRALAVYDFLWHETQDGSTTIVRAKDGTEKKLQLL